MKRTSILALLLAMVMLLGLFAGCANEPAATTPPADTPATEAPAATDEPAEEPAEEPADEPAEEPEEPAEEPAEDDKPASSGLADANSDVEYEDVVHVDNDAYSMADKIFAAMEPASTKTYPLGH